MGTGARSRQVRRPSRSRWSTGSSNQRHTGLREALRLGQRLLAGVGPIRIHEQRRRHRRSRPALQRRVHVAAGSRPIFIFTRVIPASTHSRELSLELRDRIRREAAAAVDRHCLLRTRTEQRHERDVEQPGLEIP